MAISNWTNGRIGSGRDKLRELDDLPKMETGAPIPILLTGEIDTALAYYAFEDHGNFDPDDPRSVTVYSKDMLIAIVRFDACSATYFGPPNDEAINGHPLYKRGLEAYGAYEVENSSWIAGQERMNRVHPRHSTKLFESYRHFIFTFHDSTFECTARSYRLETTRGSMAGILERLAAENSVERF